MPPIYQDTRDETVEVDLGGHIVAVPKGGLFDRYRMNTDLDEVARDPRVSSVDFFRRLPKTKVESAIGPTLTRTFTTGCRAPGSRCSPAPARSAAGCRASWHPWRSRRAWG